MLLSAVQGVGNCQSFWSKIIFKICFEFKFVLKWTKLKKVLVGMLQKSKVGLIQKIPRNHTALQRKLPGDSET